MTNRTIGIRGPIDDKRPVYWVYEKKPLRTHIGPMYLGDAQTYLREKPGSAKRLVIYHESVKP